MLEKSKRTHNLALVKPFLVWEILRIFSGD